MTPHPDISVLMPVYNAERYVAQAVRSICEQTFGNFEFLIIDDRSTDDSLPILQHYAALDRRIRLISRPNTGYVVALNEMLEMARGRWIARMDADDIALPHRFAQQCRFMRAHPEVVCCGGGYQVIDECGDRLVELFPPQSDAECQQSALRGISPISHPCAMISRAAIRQAGGYDAAMCPAEDLDLWLRLGERGELANLPRVLIKYRLHAQSVSGKQQNRQLAMTHAACRNAWARRGISGICDAQPWRPDASAVSQIKHDLQCGWWAWNSRETQTAARYARKVLKRRPLHRQGWALLGATVRQSLKNNLANTVERKAA